MSPAPWDAGTALRAYCEAFARRAPEELGELFDQDAVLDLPLLDRPVVGRRAILEELRTAVRGLRNIEVNLAHVIGSGAEAFAEGTFRAEHIGMHAQVDGSPARLDFRFVVVVLMRGGRVSRWSEYFDTKPLKPRERQHLYPISRRSAYWEGSVRAGVSEFMVYNHMYMPLAYHHSAAEEYAALTERVTMWDVGAERQTELRGPDAVELAGFLTTRNLAQLKVGDCKYTLACDPDGEIICDPVLLHPWPEVVWLSHGDADLTLWAAGVALGRELRVRVSEPRVSPIQVQGPKSLEMLRGLVESDLGVLGFYKCMVTRIAGIEAVVSRTGWSGGLGYELFPLPDQNAMALWNELLEAGQALGLMVTGPNVNRAVEKGVTDTAYHSNSHMNPYEAGHGRLVDLDKGNFVGREALRKVHADGARRKTVGLLVEGELPQLEWYWPLIDARDQPGEIRWAVHSFALDRNIAIAVVDTGVEIGEIVRFRHQGGVSRAIVTQVPFV
jgi:aminomethyltransferase